MNIIECTKHLDYRYMIDLGDDERDKIFTEINLPEEDMIGVVLRPDVIEWLQSHEMQCAFCEAEEGEEQEQEILRFSNYEDAVAFKLQWG